MATVAPFRGLLYSAARVPDLEPVIAPSQGLLTSERLDALRARSPHNIVHVDRPDPPGDEGRARAARTLAQWRDEGVVEQDPRAGLYVAALRHKARGMPERTLLGFFARLRIEEADSAMVRFTERALDEERAERAELTRALRTHVSPLVALFRDPDGALMQTLETVARRPADRWGSDTGGGDVRLWRVSDPAVVRPLALGLRDRPIWILEGAHRWAAARDVRDALRAGEEAGAPEGSRSHDFLMAFLAPLDSPGLAFMPWHRVLRGTRRFNARSLAGGTAGHLFDVKHFAFDGYDNRGEQIRRRLREAATRGRASVALYTGGAEFSLYLLRTEDLPEDAAASLPGRLRHVDVAVLETALLPLARAIAHAEDHPGAVRHTESVEEALAFVDAGEGSAALLVSPPGRDTLVALTEENLMLPAGSTCLLPRVPAGLVMDPLDPPGEVHGIPDLPPPSDAEPEPEPLPDDEPEPGAAGAP